MAGGKSGKLVTGIRFFQIPLAVGTLLALLGFGSPASAEIRFQEVASEWGLAFRHHHGGSGERYMLETMVGGVILFDYDGDGDVDVFFVDGGHLPGYRGEKPRSRLFRNEGQGRFVDVTDRAALELAGYGCGGTAGDVDGDGDLDLYLTAFGENALFRNQGDGTFHEVGRESGVADPLWSASAAFADVDRDGDLDLYVANYVDWGVDNNKFCGDRQTGVKGYCQPGVFNGLPDRLYRNRGEGVFVDEAETAGFESARNAGLGVAFADFDDDGWDDLYVANDLDPNFLFHNRGDGTFEDISLLSGAAFSDTGQMEAGMGVELADLDGDGKIDIVVTNFALETNAFYRNIGDGLFIDSRFSSNIAESSLRYLTFGVAALDLDHDQDLDLAMANGHILDNAEELSAVGEYAQANQIMENLGGGRFRARMDVGADEVRVSRGLAYGDLDGDGDLDLVINNSNQVAEVYENLGGSVGGAWLEVDLLGSGGNTAGVGARLVGVAAGTEQVRQVRTASSYLSQNALTVHFGLGEAEVVTELRLRWPTGRWQVLEQVPVNRRLWIAEP